MKNRTKTLSERTQTNKLMQTCYYKIRGKQQCYQIVRQKNSLTALYQLGIDYQSRSIQNKDIYYHRTSPSWSFYQRMRSRPRSHTELSQKCRNISLQTKNRYEREQKMAEPGDEGMVQKICQNLEKCKISINLSNEQKKKYVRESRKPEIKMKAKSAQETTRRNLFPTYKKGSIKLGAWETSQSRDTSIIITVKDPN